MATAHVDRFTMRFGKHPAELNLKVPDIGSERMTLKINQVKVQKDRYVPISPRLLTELRLYWRDQQPSQYFLPGQ